MNLSYLASQAESAWEEAKDQADFEKFLPYLEKIVATKKKFIGYWGVKDGNPYNTLLDQYEPGMTTDIIEGYFNQLKETIVPLVKKIAESGNTARHIILIQAVPERQPKEFSHEILQQLGI